MISQIVFFGIGILTGALIILCSVWLGAWIALRAKSGVMSIQEPKGDVFTVGDIDDIPFPESGESTSEKHIQKKNNSFTKMFGSMED